MKTHISFITQTAPIWFLYPISSPNQTILLGTVPSFLASLSRIKLIRWWNLNMPHRCPSKFLDYLQQYRHYLDPKLSHKGNCSQYLLRRLYSRNLARPPTEISTTKSTMYFPIALRTIKSHSRPAVGHYILCKSQDTMEWISRISSFLFLWKVLMWRSKESSNPFPNRTRNVIS